MRAALTALVADYAFLETTLLSSVVEGDKASMHWHVKVRHNPTGEVHETEMYDLWTIDGDQAKSVVQFCDTALAVELMTRAAGLQASRAG